MLKKRVLTLLLLLLCLSSCFLFGAGSVRAYALENFYNQVRPNEAPVTLYYTGVSSAPTVTPNQYGWYQFANAALENNLFLNFIFYSTWDIVFDSANYDYYYNLIVESPNADAFTFFPNQTRITELGSNLESVVYTISNDDVIYSNYSGRLDGQSSIGFSVLAKFPDNFQGSIRSFYVADLDGGSIPANLRYSITVIQTQKDASAEYVQSIVNAINNQTETIDNSIDQAADDLQQSIEDQYEFSENDDLGVGSIIEEYEEKIGILTFASDTMLDMLDLFDPANAGEPEIVVPAWSMNIQGDDYEIWQEYRFNLRQIDDAFPFLMRTVRLITVSLFYLAIVGYIQKIYERWFLAR